MMISISEFRLNSKKYFDVALNGEPVWITRGGVHYKLIVELPNQKQLQEPSE
jgi:hypothetical protein